MRSRLRLLAALLAIFALLAAACGDDDADDGAPDTTEAPTDTTEAPDEGDEGDEGEPEEEAVVRADADLVIWADDTRTPVIRPFAEEFGAANGLTVAVQELSFDAIRDRLQVAGPAGEGPDIIIGAHDWLGQLVASGVVAPVDLTAIEGDFLDVAITAVTYEGNTYGVPYAVESIALIRNTDLVPEAPATFEELVDIALGLVESGDATIPIGLQQNPGDPFHNMPLFTALGGYVFGLTEDGYDPNDLGIDSEGGLAAAVQFAEWAEIGFISSEMSYDVMIESFGEGNAPFAITGPWAIAEGGRGFRATGVPYVVEPIPPVAGGTPRPFVGVQAFMVSAFAENPLAAQTFVIDFMATEEAQLALFEAGGRQTAASDADIQGFGLAAADGLPMPAIPEMGSVWSAWTDAYQLVLTGSDPEQSFRDAANQIRNLIG